MTKEEERAVKDELLGEKAEVSERELWSYEQSCLCPAAAITVFT